MTFVFNYDILIIHFMRKGDNAMKISEPELKIIRFCSDDVIATSQFFLTAGQFDGYSGAEPYVRFDGTMRPNNDGTYRITGIHGVEGASVNDYELVTSNGDMYFPETGITIPGSNPFGANMARQTYDAYRYDEGTYYSHGASYYELYFQ